MPPLLSPQKGPSSNRKKAGSIRFEDNKEDLDSRRSDSNSETGSGEDGSSDYTDSPKYQLDKEICKNLNTV